eukprot:4907736-Pyramimonas_sp.AAC.2
MQQSFTQLESKAFAVLKREEEHLKTRLQKVQGRLDNSQWGGSLFWCVHARRCASPGLSRWMCHQLSMASEKWRHVWISRLLSMASDEEWHFGDVLFTLNRAVKTLLLL